MSKKRPDHLADTPCDGTVLPYPWRLKDHVSASLLVGKLLSEGYSVEAVVQSDRTVTVTVPYEAGETVRAFFSQFPYALLENSDVEPSFPARRVPGPWSSSVDSGGRGLP